MARYYDLIIAGAGASGATLAARLGRTRFAKTHKILLLDAKRPRFKISEDEKQWDLRTVTLSKGSQNLVQGIDGVWERLRKHGKIGRVDQMHVYDACASSSNGVTFPSPAAVVVENAALQQAVLESMPDTIDIEFDTKIEKFTAPASYHQDTQTTPLATLDDKFETPLLVGADGPMSQVKSDVGIDNVFEHDYGTRAICAQLETADDAVHTAWQRFLPSGPIGLLPLTNGSFNMVWSCESEMAARLAELDDERFVDEVNYVLQCQTAYEPELMKYLPHLPSSTKSPAPLRPPLITSIRGKRASFPLHARASAVTKPRVALVGDAAHRVHPLAGQGLNMGLRDVRSLERCILSGWFRGADIGVDDAVLGRYEQLEKLENVPLGVGVHAIDMLFRTTFQPVVAARNVGLSVVDNLPPLKNMFQNLANR